MAMIRIQVSMAEGPEVNRNDTAGRAHKSIPGISGTRSATQDCPNVKKGSRPGRLISEDTVDSGFIFDQQAFFHQKRPFGGPK